MRKNIISIILVFLIFSTINISQVKAVSSDTSLKSLKISPSVDDIKQDESNENIYRVKVNKDTTSVSIEAIPNDKNAKVEIGDTTLYQYGNNLINVKVTSESGTSTDYKIYVQRLSQNISDTSIVPNVIDNKTKVNQVVEEETIDTEEPEKNENAINNNIVEVNNINENLQADNVTTQNENIQNVTEWKNDKKTLNKPTIIVISIIVVGAILLIFVPSNKRKTKH